MTTAMARGVQKVPELGGFRGAQPDTAGGHRFMVLAGAGGLTFRHALT